MQLNTYYISTRMDISYRMNVRMKLYLLILFRHINLNLDYITDDRYK
jgi:hypothetical protein